MMHARHVRLVSVAGQASDSPIFDDLAPRKRPHLRTILGRPGPSLSRLRAVSENGTGWIHAHTLIRFPVISRRRCSLKCIDTIGLDCVHLPRPENQYQNQKRTNQMMNIFNRVTYAWLQVLSNQLVRWRSILDPIIRAAASAINDSRLISAG